jgi:hypothetical protein
MSKNKMVQLTQDQSTWLVAELESILMSDIYSVEEKLMACVIIKKLKGRTQSADKALVSSK